MMRSRVLAVLIGAAALVAGVVYLVEMPDANGANADPRDPDLVAAGRAVYEAQCASCHGADLEGEPDWRARRADGRLPAPPHDETGHTWHHPDALLFGLTKYGPAAIIGDGYESDMPGFEDVLSDDEIRAALAYIKSRWPAEILTRQERMNAR